MNVTEEQLRLLIKSALLSEAQMSKRKLSTTQLSSRSTSSSTNDSVSDIGSLSDLKFSTVSNDAAVKKANKELTFWDEGKRKENQNDDETNKKLKAYWDAANYNYPKPNVWDEPWSAAFISYVMKEGGVSDFPFSAAHTTWATKALENRKAISENPDKFKNKVLYVLFKRDEVSPKSGDLAFKLRGGGNIDAWLKKGGGQSKSHSDILVSDSEVIGGNLSDSVKKDKFDHPIIIKKIKVLGTKKEDEVS